MLGSERFLRDTPASVLLVRYVLAWLPMVLIAVANGVLRQAWLLPRLGEEVARQVSTLFLIALFSVYIAMVVRVWPLSSATWAAVVGIAWLFLTLAFELLVGLFVSGADRLGRQQRRGQRLARGVHRAGLLAWLKGFRKSPVRTFVVHGEAGTALGFAELVRKELGWRVDVPRGGDAVEVSA